MVCCEPEVCFGCGGKKSTPNDGCMCGCCCLNGPLTIMVTQFLVLVGALLSAAAMADCKFAKIYNFDNSTVPSVLLPFFPSDTTRSIGYFTFEGQDGSCYWYDKSFNNTGDQFDKYLDFLGSEWQAGRAMGSIAVVFSWLLFFYIISYCCSAQVRPARYCTGALLCIILVLFQGLIFLPLGSDFCKDYDCESSRSAGFAIGATVAFFAAGLSMIFTSDYPGGRMLFSRGTVTKDVDKDEEAEKAADQQDEEAPPPEEEEEPEKEEEEPEKEAEEQQEEEPQKEEEQQDEGDQDAQEEGGEEKEEEEGGAEEEEGGAEEKEGGGDEEAEADQAGGEEEEVTKEGEDAVEQQEEIEQTLEGEGDTAVETEEAADVTASSKSAGTGFPPK